MEKMQEHTLVWVDFKVYHPNGDSEDYITHISVPYPLEHFKALSEEQRNAICEAKLIECGIMPCGLKIREEMSDQPSVESTLDYHILENNTDRIKELLDSVDNIKENKVLIDKVVRMGRQDAEYAKLLLKLYVKTTDKCVLERFMEVYNEKDDMFVDVKKEFDGKTNWSLVDNAAERRQEIIRIIVSIDRKDSVYAEQLLSLYESSRDLDTLRRFIQIYNEKDESLVRLKTRFEVILSKYDTHSVHKMILEREYPWFFPDVKIYEDFGENSEEYEKNYGNPEDFDDFDDVEDEPEENDNKEDK